jgi:hypothetical protein
MVEVSDQERQILETIRNFNYGELHIFFKGGKPYRMEERKSVQLNVSNLGNS